MCYSVVVQSIYGLLELTKNSDSSLSLSLFNIILVINLNRKMTQLLII